MRPFDYRGTQGGDEAGLAEAYRERIRLFALRRMGDPAAAEDAAQETLRRVLEALRSGRLRDPDALPGYVFATARHVCLREMRSATRARRAVVRAGGEASPAPEDALEGLLRQESVRRIAAALGRLDADDRDLLRALVAEERETAEVAGELGVTVGALRVRKHRALKRLGRLLGDAEPPGNAPPTRGHPSPT